MRGWRQPWTCRIALRNPKYWIDQPKYLPTPIVEAAPTISHDIHAAMLAIICVHFTPIAPMKRDGCLFSRGSLPISCRFLRRVRSSPIGKFERFAFLRGVAGYGDA
jgi:hypothetical protein